MTTVSEAVRNSWMHIFSFDSAIPRSNQRETIGEVLKEINRIKDEMQTLHLRFSDIEQGKLDILSIENVESQFEKLKQQLQLHTLLISELRKYHTEIEDLKNKEEYRVQEERELKNEIRKLKNDFHLLSETVNSRNSIQNSNIPSIISKLESLQIEFDSLNNRMIKSEKTKTEVEALKRDVENLSIMKKSYDDQSFTIKQMKEDIHSIQSVIHEDIPQLKNEIQRKMNKTIQATNELKENFGELKDQFKQITEERRHDHNVITQIATQAEQLRIQIQTIKMSQKDSSSSKMRQEELVNQCVKNIAKLAESVNNLQEKISNHLIGLSMTKSANSYSVVGSKSNSHIKTPIVINKTTPKGNYYEVATNGSENYKRIACKSKNSPRSHKYSNNHFSLPDTPSTQAPPILSSNSAGRLSSFFGNRELSGIASSSSLASSNYIESSNIDSINNSRPTTNNTCDQEEDIIASSTIEEERIINKRRVPTDEFMQDCGLKHSSASFLEIKSSVNSSEETNCTSSGENFLIGNNLLHPRSDLVMMSTLTESNSKLSSSTNSPKKSGERSKITSCNGNHNTSDFLSHF
ncbi:uncharacterized protein cubi_02499 [Cryptosporidium ubiquitum]|uniref:Uncharacterized protein n=1 Tax=Cryptosporidium ubiquitum TaxID=857276 RepID=A0A1J4MIH4_9CRYT|nr:uncharacterized protein cubi_02499 [Cryptosporidium ubiquitum]OII73267.1 hypothetical protein cubi_02499 [Cryptosporidium ubiquitum]